jgi:aspartyl-tRNA(Asn)/glutamyl-tRNA(Gln) amidotransferase subunit A
MTEGRARVGQLGITELLGQYRAKVLSPVDAVQSVIDDIARVNPDLNAVLRVSAATASQAAEESTARWKSGDPRPLEGVPFLVKDVICTAGIETSFGGVVWRGFVPERDAWIVSRLRNAGAIPVGKTNTNELACGDVSNPHYGPVRNPWNPARSPGGSSSGSAAAVAAGLAPFSLGSDSAGSVRTPAAFCGVTGFKPTNGLIPLDGSSVVSESMDCLGPIARSVGDVAAVMKVLADLPSPVDISRPQPLAGVRLALIEPWSLREVPRGCEVRYRDGVADLRRLGAQVDVVDLKHGDDAWAAGWVMLHADMPQLWKSLPDRGPLLANIDRLDPKLAYRLLTALMLSATDYALARQLREMATGEVHSLLESSDAIVTLTSPSVAPLAGGTHLTENTRRAATASRQRMLASRLPIIANVVGLPAISVPCGLSDGLPVGLQLIGRPFADGELLQLAYTFQEATGHHLGRPV